MRSQIVFSGENEFDVLGSSEECCLKRDTVRLVKH